MIRFLVNSINKLKQQRVRWQLGLSESVLIGKVQFNYPNVSIGNHSYLNDVKFSCSSKAGVKIGSWCSIGYNVSFVACTHDVNFPTGPISERPLHEKDIVIGSGVWIGNNVVILPGVEIGDAAVIGANAVVTKNVPERAVVGGVPAKIIKIKDLKECEAHYKIFKKDL